MLRISFNIIPKLFRLKKPVTPQVKPVPVPTVQKPVNQVAPKDPTEININLRKTIEGLIALLDKSNRSIRSQIISASIILKKPVPKDIQQLSQLNETLDDFVLKFSAALDNSGNDVTNSTKFNTLLNEEITAKIGQNPYYGAKTILREGKYIPQSAEETHKLAKANKSKHAADKAAQKPIPQSGQSPTTVQTTGSDTQAKFILPQIENSIITKSPLYGFNRGYLKDAIEFFNDIYSVPIPKSCVPEDLSIAWWDWERVLKYGLPNSPPCPDGPIWTREYSLKNMEFCKMRNIANCQQFNEDLPQLKQYFQKLMHYMSSRQGVDPESITKARYSDYCHFTKGDYFVIIDRDYLETSIKITRDNREKNSPFVRILFNRPHALGWEQGRAEILNMDILPFQNNYSEANIAIKDGYKEIYLECDNTSIKSLVYYILSPVNKYKSLFDYKLSHDDTYMYKMYEHKFDEKLPKIDGIKTIQNKIVEALNQNNDTDFIRFDNLLPLNIDLGDLNKIIGPFLK